MVFGPRRMMAVAAVLVGACSTTPGVTTTTPATTTLAATTTSPPPAPTTTSVPESICLSGDLPFADAGPVADLGAGTGDAEQLAALRWAEHPGCERVVLDLLTAAAAPASGIGASTVAVLDGTGIVRVTLPESVQTTGIFDTLLDGELARRAYVVRLPEGTLAVDIHTGASVPVQARAFTVDAPARIVVDLAPTAAGGAAVASPPVIGGNVVVLSPTSGVAGYPIVITGYARTFEATVIARAISGIDVAAETFTTAADWTDAWGSFSMTIESGPPGLIMLFVGEDSARDGTPVGVDIELMVP